MINSTMSEIIYNQRKEDNKIILYKNYSNINHHVFNNDIYLPIKPNKGRKIFYFYDVESIHYTKNNHIKLELVKNTAFQLTKPIQIKRNYNNPFARLDLKLYERNIKKNGDNLIISSYFVERRRELNCRIFSRDVRKYIISFNTKTGNFTTIKNVSRNKTLIRKNSFSQLKEIFTIICKSGNFENNQFYNTLYSLFNDNYSTSEQYTYENVMDSIYGFFIKQKRIKVPNDYIKLLNQCYPTEVFFKKNDRKLFMSILDKYKIKSNITNKILHQYPDINLKPFASFLQLLGKDFNKYVGNLNITEFIHNEDNRTVHFDVPSTIYSLTNKDKENLVKIVNDIDQRHYNFSTHTLIVDHINMLSTLREYNFNININATTSHAFDIEHREFSKLHDLIKRGTEIQYIFSEKTIKEIEEPLIVKINIDDNVIHETFYPVLLKKETEYVDEGKIMHHCVGSYANKTKSVIVSIRTKDNTDRITCEFDTATGRCIQARHIQNAQPPGDFVLALDELKKKTTRLALYGILHSIETKYVPIVINGIEVKKETPVPYLQEELF